MRSDRALILSLFLASAAVLLLELTLTRLFSVFMWYHFASLSVAVALFGFAAGGVLVHLRPDLAPDLSRPGRLGAYLAAFSAASALPFGLLWALTARPALLQPLLSFFHQPYYQPFRQAAEGPDLHILLSLAVLYAVIILPFAAAGLFFASVFFRTAPGWMGSFYASDLAGGAAGCLLAVPGLALLGAPSLLLVAAALGAAAAALLLLGKGRVLGFAAAALLAVLGAVNGPGDRLARLSFARGQLESRILFSGWNALSRVVVYPLSRWETEQAWGLSRRYQGEIPAQMGMLVDDAGYTPILSWGRGPGDWAPYHVVSLAFLLRPGASAYIIGPGGGRDILSALGSGAGKTVAVELNPLEVAAVEKTFGDFSGRPYSLVETIVGEGRSVLDRRGERFGVIQASSVFGEVSPSAGAFSLSANFLYTKEAFREYWEHLTDDGILSFSWSLYGHRVQRIVSLARDLVLEKGLAPPERSIAVLRERGLATVLVARKGFTDEETARLESLARDLAFTVEALPGKPPDSTNARIIRGEDPFEGRYDLSPPTDDKPFFYHDVPKSRFFSMFLSFTDAGERHVAVLRGMGVLFLVLTLLLLALPLFAGGFASAGPPGLFGRASLFFLGIGLGYMLIELTLMHRLVLFLGDPISSLSVVLATLLAASGAGSLWAGRRPIPGRLSVLVPVASALLILSAGAAAGSLTPSVPLPQWQRVALVIVLLAVPGFLMGWFMPTGLAVLARGRRELVAWAWALNGAASVLGSFLSLAVAMNFGYSRALVLGLFSYALTVPFLLWREGREGEKEAVA